MAPSVIETVAGEPVGPFTVVPLLVMSDDTDAEASFRGAKTKVIGISKDSAASHDKFKKKYELPFTLASDKDGHVCEDYGTWAEKSMYGRTYFGIVRTTFLIGADGRIAKVWPRVSVAGHAEEVLAAAKAL